MKNLLDTAIEAHGGSDRWRQLDRLTAHVSIGGAMWHLKGWPDVFADASVDIDPHRQRTEYRPFLQAGQHAVFEPDRVAVVADDGKVLDERQAPREAFAGHGLATPWDALHLVYFAGYAMWTYLTAPFLFKLPGFEAKEIEPWDEDGETWRRLQVRFPEDFHSHCREQVFYFGDDGLLRRHDYRVDVMGSGGTSAHYASDHRSFGGIVFPTRRRVHAIGPDNRPLRDRVLVSIDVHDVKVD